METFGFIILSYVHANYNKQIKPILQNRLLNYQEKIIQIIDKLLEVAKQDLKQYEQNCKDIASVLFKHIIKFQKDNFKNNRISEYFTTCAMHSTGIDLRKFADDQDYFNAQVQQAYMHYNQNLFPTFPAN